MRIGIIQSNYIPWRGYFDFIDSVDHFVLLDDVQYTKRDWRNRNKIKSGESTQWLTIPVEVSGKYYQRIEETLIAEASWVRSHLAALQRAYARSDHFETYWPLINSWFEEVQSERHLSLVNERLIRRVCETLAITTPIYRSSSFSAPEDKNLRLISIVKSLGGDEYLSGPAARGYIDEQLWADEGVSVLYKSYQGYRDYMQPTAPFIGSVSILDLLFNCGPSARDFLKSTPAHE